MHQTDWDVFAYEACAGIDGQIHRIPFGRRNRQRFPLFHPNWCTQIPTPSLESTENALTIEELCHHLNRLERRTWLQILNRRSILEIAEQEGVTRAAIYWRIRGKNGFGGMVAKNPYVARWWKVRKQNKHL